MLMRVISKIKGLCFVFNVNKRNIPFIDFFYVKQNIFRDQKDRFRKKKLIEQE